MERKEKCRRELSKNLLESWWFRRIWTTWCLKQSKKIMRVLLLNQGKISWRWIIHGTKYWERLRIMKNKTQKWYPIIREYKEVTTTSRNQYFKIISGERNRTLQKWYQKYRLSTYITISQKTSVINDPKIHLNVE